MSSLFTHVSSFFLGAYVSVVWSDTNLLAGDHFVTIKVDIPTSVSSADRELLTKLKEGTTAGKGFFSK